MVGNLPKGERFAKTRDSTPCCCSYEAISVRKLLFMCRLRPEKKKELKKTFEKQTTRCNKRIGYYRAMMGFLIWMAELQYSISLLIHDFKS